MTRRTVRVFVARSGNRFMRDIASWIVEAAALTGRAAELVDDDRLPDARGTIDLVVAPHEFFELSSRPTAELQRAAAASVCLCTEQPGTPWFHLSVDACRRGVVSLDMSPQGVQALGEVGVVAHHLHLGSVPSIEVASPGGDRPIDVLFLGGLDDRRGRALAELAPRLHRRHAELRMFPFDRPVTAGTPGVLFGDDKYRLLAASRVLVNLHRDRSMHLPPGTAPRRYFEWARMVEAMANGCVVISEPSDDIEPLIAGTHLIETDLDGIADAIDEVLDDEPRRAAIAAAAHDVVTGPLALEHSLAPLLDLLERDVVPLLPMHVRTSNPTRGLWRLGSSHVAPPVRLGPFRPYLDILSRAKAVALAENAALRRLDAAACVIEHGSHQHLERVATPSFAAATPEVSVIVSVYNYADVVTDTLDSIVASEDVSFEVLVIDDHATDHSRQVVRDHLARHPDIPMMLVAKDANEGLASARNLGFQEARSAKVMVMDADNTIYPECLRRLADALDADPTAAAAHSVLEDFGDQRGVRSAFAWDVERLCGANYIDAQAMWRRDRWQQLGGYRDDDDHVFGWEDWDLWLRLAATGGHALIVPQILGRYRVQRGSMIALTNLATDDAIEALRARYPELPWPASTAGRRRDRVTRVP